MYITNRYCDGLVGVVHRAVCGSSKCTGTRMCFEKVGVALQSLMHMLYTAAIPCEADILQGYCSTPGACNNN